MTGDWWTKSIDYLYQAKDYLVDWLEPDAWLTGGWLTGDWLLVDWSTGGWLVGRLVVGWLVDWWLVDLDFLESRTFGPENFFEPTILQTIEIYC